MINAAIVGLGWWGRNLVEAVQGKSGRIRFVHGVTKEPDAVRDLAAACGLQISTELSDVLRDPSVDAVVLATPHSLHVDQIVAVAEAGKPVFCEKPLAMSRSEALRAVTACDRARVPLGVGHNKRFWPSMVALRQVMESGTLGRLLQVEGTYTNENSGRFDAASWRNSADESPAGGMTGPGIHLLDALVGLAGSAESVSTQLVRQRPEPNALDTVSVLLRFGHEVSGFLSAIRLSPFYWRVHAFGTDGSVEALGETEIVVRRRGERAEARRLDAIDSILAELEAFADAACGVSAFPITPPEMIATAAAFEAILRSIKTGRPVEVEQTGEDSVTRPRHGVHA